MKRKLTGPITERAVSSRLFSREDFKGSTGGGLIIVERGILRGFSSKRKWYELGKRGFMEDEKQMELSRVKASAKMRMRRISRRKEDAQ